MTWISIKDKIPKPKKNVLVCSAFKKVMGVAYMHPLSKLLRMTSVGEPSFIELNLKPKFEPLHESEVTHWMEFPEFPREKK